VKPWGKKYQVLFETIPETGNLVTFRKRKEGKRERKRKREIKRKITVE
jgi:3-dehydroquinate dehydratase